MKYKKVHFLLKSFLVLLFISASMNYTIAEKTDNLQSAVDIPFIQQPEPQQTEYRVFKELQVTESRVLTFEDIYAREC